VPDGDAMFLHQDEGPDDMSAHIRTVLTNPDLTMPVNAGQCDLGIWQGVYLWEHRMQRHNRKIIVTVMGE
jgi:secondary thiamine-phosphate synthase enzyme